MYAFAANICRSKPGPFRSGDSSIPRILSRRDLHSSVLNCRNERHLSQHLNHVYLKPDGVSYIYLTRGVTNRLFDQKAVTREVVPSATAPLPVVKPIQIHSSPQVLDLLRTGRLFIPQDASHEQAFPPPAAAAAAAAATVAVAAPKAAPR